MLEVSKLPVWFWFFLFFAVSTFVLSVLFLFAPSIDDSQRKK